VYDERDGRDAAALPEVGTLTYVMRREDETWRIALAQTTPVMA
jgi:hypothetical protein